MRLNGIMAVMAIVCIAVPLGDGLLRLSPVARFDFLAEQESHNGQAAVQAVVGADDGVWAVDLADILEIDPTNALLQEVTRAAVFGRGPPGSDGLPPPDAWSFGADRGSDQGAFGRGELPFGEIRTNGSDRGLPKTIVALSNLASLPPLVSDSAPPGDDFGTTGPNGLGDVLGPELPVGSGESGGGSGAPSPPPPLPLPEPASWALMLVGVGAIGLALRRARRAGPDDRWLKLGGRRVV